MHWTVVGDSLQNFRGGVRSTSAIGFADVSGPDLPSESKIRNLYIIRSIQKYVLALHISETV
jgi:hypothetical protein